MRYSSKTIFQLDPFPVEVGYRLVENCSIRWLLGDLAFSYSACLFFQALNSSEFSYVKHIFSLKYSRMNPEVFPLALKKMPLNYVTSVPIHSVLNISHKVIGPTSTIEWSTSWYIVRKVIITERGLFSIQPSFCAVFFPKNFLACFEFTLFQIFLSELWG